ncbi:hypothetical protein SARC_07246 [Sphaeroforma arctica JP610]|uniref:Uncharacterized protein n=1 Tax=Sphaeroforma arctica JP610 TaxID=667725 RepID=A0A0L0FUP5_9EUKA|nr:hypothetical protein SARC_07246 [Sphaeroforma arctica JP610]KNC80389.1 hypothetical protein SARC_07246 [Sphaeroforma arctica JP610]|eukprot:XP_014154291.1 hypothetical protein SARC_07246 [Sphaeroforma arctica JP610]
MPMRILMWLLGEITIIATDMPEVIGFGVALQGRYLETVVAIFMVILGVLLIAEMVMSNIDAGEMAYNWVVPSVLEGSAFSGLGIVGAVVMPHNLFLQTSSAMLRNKKATNSLLKLDEIQEVDSAPASGGKSEVGNPPVGDEIEMSNCSDSREGSRADICRGTASTANIRIKASPATLKRRLWFAMLEPVVPVLFTFVMSLAIMCIAAALIYPRGQLDPSDPLYIDPTSVGLSNFPDYFQNGFMKYMWAIALLASAQAGSITTTLTGQYLMDGLVHLRIASWKRSLITRSLAIVPGVIVTSVNSSADASNAVIAVVNAVLAIMLPVFLFPLIR